MKCPKCNNEMIISEWDGWIWLCVFCDYEGHIATPDEQATYDNEQREAFNQFLNGELN